MSIIQYVLKQHALPLSPPRNTLPASGSFYLFLNVYGCLSFEYTFGESWPLDSDSSYEGSMILLRTNLIYFIGIGIVTKKYFFDGYCNAIFYILIV